MADPSTRPDDRATDRTDTEQESVDDARATLGAQRTDSAHPDESRSGWEPL